MPDHLKAILVDDWENVTKNQELVPIPHIHPVSEILDDYLAYERPNREEGSASQDILEETISGFRGYFDTALGRILLYKLVVDIHDLQSPANNLPSRFERQQYREMHKLWSSADADSKHKSAVDTYGAEHLCRLLGKRLTTT